MSDISQAALMRLLVAQVPPLAVRAVKVPTKRLATVESFDGANARVVLDGDPAAVTIQVAVPGGVWPQQRVVVDFYPPHGALVTGILSGSAIGEAVWRTTYSVASAVGGSTSPAAWILESPSALGCWTDAAGVLACSLPGWWDLSLHGTFVTGAAGTIRAVRLDITGGAAILGSADAGTGSTVGYGHGLDAATPVQLAAGNTVTAFARQDSGGPLDVTLRLRARWVGPRTA